MIYLLFARPVIASPLQIGPTGADFADAAFAYGALILLVGFSLWDGFSKR